MLVARGADALTRLADDLARDHGVSAETLPADLGDADGLASVAEHLGDPERPVEIVVNNAGRGTGGPFVELPVGGELAQVDLNVTALVRLTHAALAAMVPRRHGGVLNVASLGGFQPAPFNATYSATKAFVLSFSEAVREEVRTAGVHVSCLCPGFTRTGFRRRRAWMPRGSRTSCGSRPTRWLRRPGPGWAGTRRWSSPERSTRPRPPACACFPGWPSDGWPGGSPAVSGTS